MKTGWALFTPALLAVGSGCVGARTVVMAPRSEYPVSLSRGIRDADGTLVPAERRKVVGSFKLTPTAWAMFWSAIPLTPLTDISDAVNAQVSAVNGDAIIHLMVVTKHCALNSLVFPLGILPVWPSCADMEITGDIVRVQPAVALPPSAPPPPATAAFPPGSP